MLRSVPGTERAERVADVVFVHGLNPLGVLNRDHAFKTWGGKDEHSEFWPKWLGEDLAKADIPVGVWILEYDAAALGWLGHAMPLPDRATSVLDELYGKRIGDRPTIFVAHSLGGLVVKQMLQRSATMGLTTERAIAERTRGVMFLATPHTGADMATFVSSLGRVLRQTDALKELAANSAPLRELSTWYLNQSPRLGIETRSYFETRETMGIRVVDETSADPHVAGASAVPIDANHSEIAAIPSRSAPHYESIVRFVEEALCIQTATQADPPATRVGSDPDSRWIGGTIVPANPEWNVPPAPVYFTGQEEYLDQVAAALKKSRVGGIFQAAALHGFGGIGKTALALRYAELHRDEYAKGYFVASESADSLTSGFAQHCGQVLPANAPPEMMEAAAREGLRKMAEGGLSLIIFDNADDLIGKCALFDEALRELRSRHVLVTSRNSSFIERCEPVEIEKMDSKVGGFFFYRLWKRNPDAEWEGVPPSEQAVCEEMSRELDGMPLALEQAGIAAVDESLDPRTLLKDYRERKSRRIAMLKGRPSGHGQVPLWATVERALDGLSPAARELVILCAFMDPDFIDERLFTDWKMKLPDVLEASRDAWPAVRAEAIRSALIKGVTEQDPLVSEGNPRSRFSIHRAVQATILEMGSERQADRWWEGGGEAALALHALGRFREGLPHAELSAAKRQELLAPDDPKVATDLNNLAQLLQKTNRLAEAEPLMRRVLAIDEKRFGPDHPKVFVRLNNLAQLLHDTNRLAEAEPLMRRALAIGEKSLGPDHPEVATELNNLALLLHDTNRLAGAEPLMRRALAIDERSFGSHDPKVATELGNLASLLEATNRLAEAEPLMRRALAIDEKSFGPNHPEVATRLSNLAALLYATNRLAEAEPLMRRALAIDEKSFGPDHPSVARALNNLAQLLKATSRLAEAEALMRRALAIDEKSLGRDHPDVATGLSNLAALLYATDRLEEAEPLIRRAAQIWRCFDVKTGHRHPTYEVGLGNFAAILSALGRSEAEIEAEVAALRDLDCP